jgi:pimeloyl-ACP methyl ester carboxylesterase
MARLDLFGLLDPGPGSDYGTRGRRSAWLDIDWPAHTHRVEVEGAEINYVEMGEGPVALFVHGLGAMWQSWLENIPELARDHRVIALDLPGFGRSEMPVEEISIDGYARLVASFMDKVGVDRATVIGNSMGGFIGAELAIRNPERVERLVLVSPAILWQEYKRAKPLTRLAVVTEASATRAMAGSQKMARTRPRLRHLALMASGFRYPHLLSPELSVEMIRTARRTKGFVPALQALADFPLREELPKIAAPTLVVWGAHDPLVHRKHAHELKQLIPNVELVIFERTGHEAMAERPERFHRVLREFLERTEPYGSAELESEYEPAPL